MLNHSPITHPRRAPRLLVGLPIAQSEVGWRRPTSHPIGLRDRPITHNTSAPLFRRFDFSTFSQAAPRRARQNTCNRSNRGDSPYVTFKTSHRRALSQISNLEFRQCLKLYGLANFEESKTRKTKCFRKVDAVFGM